jgi:exodeoxyribonuclease VII large subunit
MGAISAEVRNHSVLEQIDINWGLAPAFYSVSELTGAIRGLLTDHFTDIWVAGEISGTRVPASGHYYFTLKDEAAQLKSVCYKMTARYLKFKPQDGIAVLARGRIDMYDARGEVQFVVEAIEPQGHGALQLAFEQLKKKLAAEGLFESARKRPLPALPARIGIVTSPTGAVIRDILQILERRFPGRHIRIYPAQVQGDGAIEQVVAGLEYFSKSRWAEVVIVARGGGSLEDLWTFNEERVARAIVNCAVPVISAIGHETDFTIADFVADLRAPTPSAAAELVIRSRQSLFEVLDSCTIKLTQTARLNLAMRARALHRISVDQATLHRAIGRRMQRIDELEYRVRDLIREKLERRKRILERLRSRLTQLDVRLKFAAAHRRIESSEGKILQSIRLRMIGARGKLSFLDGPLAQLSPLKILDRGYAIVEKDGKIVKAPNDAPADSEVNIRIAHGNLRGRIL